MQRIVPIRFHLFLFSFLVLGLTVYLITSPYLQAAGPEIILDGQLLTSKDNAAEIREGRTFVPLRLLSEAIGLTVEYHAEGQRIDLAQGRFSHIVGESFISLANGETVDIGVASYIQDGRTMVSLRLFAELIGCDVQFDSQHNRVSVQTESLSSLTETSPATLALQGAFISNDSPPPYPIQGEISIDDEGAELIFWALEDVHNIRIIAVDYLPIEETEASTAKTITDDTVEAETILVEKSQLANIEYLKKGAAFIITDRLPALASQPHTKIAYMTASDQEQAFLISFSEKENDLQQIVIPFHAAYVAKAGDSVPGPQLHVAEVDVGFLATHTEAETLEEIIVSEKGLRYALWTDQPLYNLQITQVQPSIDETSGLILYEDRDVIFELKTLHTKQLLIFIAETPEEIASLRFHYRLGSRNGSEESCLFAWIDEKAAPGLILDASVTR